MTEYGFEYESLHDIIQELRKEIEILKKENIETTNTLYEIWNQLDSMKQTCYNINDFSLGDS